MLVAIEGLTRRFADRAVCDDLSLTIDEGQFVAVVGPSGSGKSTLLHCVASIDQADAGRIVVGTTDLSTLDETARSRYRRQAIGMVFQHSNLLSSLSVLENVLLRWSLDRRIGDNDRQKALEMLRAVDMAYAADRFPDTLSGGEQQRVAIAAALVHKPSLVIADEPTGALDAERADQVMDLFIDLARAHGSALVVATHAADIADRADVRWHLRGGKVTVS